MKKLFSLFAVAVMAVSLMAEGIAFSFTSVDDTVQTKSGITIVISKAKGQSAPQWNTTSSHLRAYENNTITISGASITRVELTCSKTKSGKAYAPMTANVGSLVSGGESTAVGESKTDVWTGSATQVVFTIGKGQRAIESIVVNGDGDTPTPPTPPTPSGDVVVTGLTYGEAYYDGGYWDFNLMKGLVEETEDIVFPEVYFSADDEAESDTQIAGTWNIYWAGYWASANDSVMDDQESAGTMTVTCVEDGTKYNFSGSFVGEDGKVYSWNAQNVVVTAWDEWGEQIALTDKGGSTPTPPTPVGDEITIAQAESIANALADNKTTTVTYTIKGYVGTLFESSGNFFLVEEAGGRSDLQVYHPTVDRALTKGDYVQVVGKLQKYISKKGNAVLEVVNATVTHIGETALMELPSNVNVKKLMMQHKVLIMHNGHLFNMAGERVK